MLEEHYSSARPSVRLSSVHLSVTLSPPKPLGGIQPKVLLPLMAWLCESNIIFQCVCAYVVRPSVRHLLLNHWPDFNQNCCIIFPHGNGVREQHYFSLRRSSVHLSVTLFPSKPLGGIQPNLLHHFPSWLGRARATLFFLASVRRLSICPSGYLLNHWAEFNQTCYMTFPHGKGVG